MAFTGAQKILLSKYRWLTPRLLVRCITTTVKVNENPKYTPIYKFSYIRGVSMINRLKFYQTGLSIFGPPLSLVLHKLSWVNSDIVLATLGIAISGCTFLYTLGYITNNLVGIMYVNNKKSDLKIAYVDFWGHRKDIVVPIKDNVPSSEIPVSHTDSVYWKFKNLSTPHAFKVSTKFGNVLDKEMFYKIFSKDVY